jgi:hypothetical protein
MDTLFHFLRPFAPAAEYGRQAAEYTIGTG